MYTLISLATSADTPVLDQFCNREREAYPKIPPYSPQQPPSQVLGLCETHRGGIWYLSMGTKYLLCVSHKDQVLEKEVAEVSMGESWDKLLLPCYRIGLVQET